MLPIICMLSPFGAFKLFPDRIYKSRLCSQAHYQFLQDMVVVLPLNWLHWTVIHCDMHRGRASQVQISHVLRVILGVRLGGRFGSGISHAKRLKGLRNRGLGDSGDWRPAHTWASAAYSQSVSPCVQCRTKTFINPPLSSRGPSALDVVEDIVWDSRDLHPRHPAHTPTIYRAW